MSSKKFSWKKLVLTVMWTVVCTATIVLLVAAARNKNGKRCKDVIVTIKGVDETEYVSKKQILNTISGGRPDLMKGAPIKTFDLQQLEELLERNLWIRNAELFFDNNDVLHADITEREPVARVFMVNGESFYVDDMGEQLPITNDQVARVPVFTSFPNETTAARKKDSLLQEQVKEMGHFLLKNDFWMAQVDQVNINNYEFELVPKLGNHLIQFGNTEKMEQKFSRLLLFYKNIMNRTGWNYYSALDVRYDKQLVAVRRDSVSLFKSFVVEQNNYEVSRAIDTSYINSDTTLTTEKPIINNEPNSLLTSGTYKREPTSAEPVLKSATVKPETTQNRNSLKDQLPTPATSKVQGNNTQEKKTTIQPKAKPKTEEETVLNEAKSQPVKKQPKAVMKKKENE
jgi:cell division protein FtsQ